MNLLSSGGVVGFRNVDVFESFDIVFEVVSVLVEFNKNGVYKNGEIEFVN